MVRPVLSQITTQGMSYHTVDVVSVLISIFFFFSSFFQCFALCVPEKKLWAQVAQHFSSWISCPSTQLSVLKH